MCPNGLPAAHLIKSTDFSPDVNFGNVVNPMESDPVFLSGPRRYVHETEKSSLEDRLLHANLQLSDAPVRGPESLTRWSSNPGPLFVYADCLESKSGSMNDTVDSCCAKMHPSCSPASPLIPEYVLRGIVSSMESDHGSLVNRHMSEREVEEHNTYCDVLLMDLRLHVLVEHFETRHVFVVDLNQPQAQLRPQPPFPPPANLQAQFTTPNGKNVPRRRADLSRPGTLSHLDFDSSSTSQASSNGSSSGFDFYAIDTWPKGTISFTPSSASSRNSISNSSTRSNTLGEVAGALLLIRPLRLTNTDGIEMTGIRSSPRNSLGAPLLTTPVAPFANAPSELMDTDFQWTARRSGELATPMVCAQYRSQGQGQLYLAGPSPIDTGRLPAKQYKGKVFSHPYANGFSSVPRVYEHLLMPLSGSSSGVSTSAAAYPSFGYPRYPYEYYVRGLPGSGNTDQSSALAESATQQGKAVLDFPHKEDFLQAEDCVLQKVADIIQFLGETNSIRNLDRFLTHTAEKRGIFPSAIFLSGVSRIGNNYTFGGGFADVWKGLYKGRDVALKVLRIFNRADREKMQIDISKEALLWRRLDHPNILPFLGICRDVFESQLALVSPWMEKGNLVQYLEDTPQADCLKLAIGVAHGLEYLHSLRPQIIHGDLRAANVLVDENDEPRITDFGLSRAIDSQGTSFSESFKAGTLHWQAPELIRVAHFGEGNGKLTEKGDVYAFSCLCYEIFTGKAPFHGLRDGQVIQLVITMNRRPPWPGNAAVLTGLSNDIWSIMQLCWKTQPSDRPDMPFVVSQLQEIYDRRNTSYRRK